MPLMCEPEAITINKNMKSPFKDCDCDQTTTTGNLLRQKAIVRHKSEILLQKQSIVIQLNFDATKVQWDITKR